MAFLPTAAILGTVLAGQAALFSDRERDEVLRFWSQPGRYDVGLPKEAATSGPFQVRLTVAGSSWLWNYAKTRGIPKGQSISDFGLRISQSSGKRAQATEKGLTPQTPPSVTNQTEGGASGTQSAIRNPQSEIPIWENWIDAKVAYDRWLAAKACASLNAAVLGKPFPVPDLEPEPGPIPESLLALAGNPPAFAEPATPAEHRVRFDDREIVYVDNRPMRPRYAYYRFPQGVQQFGKRVRDLTAKDLKQLFEEAGVTESERKVMAAVSMLEGGFESVNTYDSGFVSVGLIQFACLNDGAGSLGQLLRRHKADNPRNFQADFRRFGIDVTPEGTLVALDLTTGAELTGVESARKIIDDKRLIAVFQRAGEASRWFRIAQIRVARDLYYPGSDSVAVQVGEKVLKGRISEFAKSEAALAVLMDRKVNTGKLEGLEDVLAYCAEACGAKSLKDLAPYERDIAAFMKFRAEYLADPSLSQPGPGLLAKRDYEAIASRRAQRSARKPPEG